MKALSRQFYVPINCNPQYLHYKIYREIIRGYKGRFANKIAPRCGVFATTKILFFSVVHLHVLAMVLS